MSGIERWAMNKAGRYMERITAREDATPVQQASAAELARFVDMIDRLYQAGVCTAAEKNAMIERVYDQ